MENLQYFTYKNCNNVIEINTKFISIPYLVRSRYYRETVQFPIGVFKIQINMGSHEVKFTNLTRVIKHDALHPHILRDNTCWGNFDYRTVLNTHNLAEILSSFVSYLESYNHNSPYVNIFDGWLEFVPEEDKICKHTCKFLHHKEGRPKQLVNDEPRHPVYGLPMSMVPYVALKFEGILMSMLPYYTDMSKSIVDEILNTPELNAAFKRAISRNDTAGSIVQQAIKQIRARASQPKAVASGSSN